MKWSQLLAFSLVALIGGVSTTAIASEPGEEDLEPADEVRKRAEELTEHSDPKLRAAALITIGHIGTDEQQALIETFRSADGEDERLAAGAALILAGNSQGTSYTSEQVLEARNTYEALRSLSAILSDDDLVAIVDHALNDGSGAQQGDILRFLGAQTGTLYGRLTDLLRNSDEELRQAAHQALVYTARKETLEVAESLTSHRDASIRRQSLDITDALASRRDIRSGIIEILDDLVGDSDEEIQTEAARQLVKLGEEKGTNAFLERLPQMEPEARVDALEFLLAEDIEGDLDILRPIIEEVEMADDEDREEERLLLYEFAATDADSEFIADLREKFASTIFEERLVAARSLGRTGREDVLNLLASGIGEGNADIRRYSARAMGHLGHTDALNHLRSALTGERDQSIRLEMINAIGQISDEQSVRILRFLVTDRDPEIKAAIAAALDNIGLPEATQGLEILIRDRDTDVKWTAFLALLRIDAERAQRHVSTLMRNPPDTFANDIDPYRLTSTGVDAIYPPMLSHDRSRVRNIGAEQAVVHRDVVLPVARRSVLSADLDDEVRRNLTHLIISQGDDEDLALLERIIATFSDEPAAVIAAWHLVQNANSAFDETFEAVADDEDDSVLGVIARLALLKSE